MEDFEAGFICVDMYVNESVYMRSQYAKSGPTWVWFSDKKVIGSCVLTSLTAAGAILEPNALRVIMHAMDRNKNRG